MDTARLVADLSRPEAHASAPARVDFLQTHISLLFFAGDRVYKVKKPVDLGFLDFTTSELRRHFCEEEVRLNRRLAPRVYLGVVPVVRGADGRARIGARGDEAGAVDWAVEMLRLPEARMLDQLLDRGEIDNALLGALVDLLVRFHADAATGAGVDEHGAPEAVAANSEATLARLRPFAADAPSGPGGEMPPLSRAHLAFLESRSRAFLSGRRELLRRRVSEGRIREGHGDLHAGNLCVTDEGIVAYDCIEFSAAFRCSDVACDLAFLAMDLDDRGFPGFAAYLVKRYGEAARDAELPELMTFYKGYRAVVRGLVAALAAADPLLPVEERSARRLESSRYLQLAAAYELPAALVLMCGLPATGKSWLARRIGRALRAFVFQSDARRKVLFGGMASDGPRGGYEAGLYAPELKDRTYRALLEDSLEALAAGHAVVVDATFSKRAARAPFLAAAKALGHPCFVVHVSADEATVRERLERRAREGGQLSDADWSVYSRERETFETPDEVEPRRRIEVRSGAGPPEAASGAVLERMIAENTDWLPC